MTEFIAGVTAVAGCSRCVEFTLNGKGVKIEVGVVFSDDQVVHGVVVECERRQFFVPNGNFRQVVFL